MKTDYRGSLASDEYVQRMRAYGQTVGPCGAANCTRNNEAGYVSIINTNNGNRIWRCMDHVKFDLLELIDLMGRPLCIDLFPSLPRSAAE